MSRSLSPKKISESARVFSALGDETRLALVQKLVDESPLSITELSKGTTLSRQAVTKHLKVLEEAEVVKYKKKGRESQFEIRPQALNDAKKSLERISRRWEHTLNRLKIFAENTE